MKCPRCRVDTRFNLFFMGFLDYRLGYVVLECAECHDSAFSLNMSNLKEIGDYLIGDFRLCELPDETLSSLVHSDDLDLETKRFALKEMLKRKAPDREVVISNHGELRGKKANLESLLDAKRKNGRFTNGAL